MTAVPEIIPIQPQHEAQEVDGNSSYETTKELFRRDSSPPSENPSVTESPANKTPAAKPGPQPRSATKKKSNSGIPLRLKPAANKATRSSYRHTPPAPMGPVINKNTLEVQFMNNKKRLLQLHAELVEKQRPLTDMHKSLLRTKKQLEEMGKKVILEDLKIISLKTEEAKPQVDGGGENPAAETVMNLKNSIESVLDTCVTVCKKCLVKRDNVVHLLESAKSAMDPEDFEAEVEELKKEKTELEQAVDTVVKENEKKIEDLINNWQRSVKMKFMSDEVSARIEELESTVKQQQKLLQEAEDNVHGVTRKFEDRKNTFEKALSELQEKYSKLEDEFKKEKKCANDNLMKSRNLRGKVTEMEVKTKEAEEKSTDTANKLKQIQEQMRRKEVQWMKEKEEFKKNEALLQQKFAEKQSQLNTRLNELEELQKNTESTQQHLSRNLETQLEIKTQEFLHLQKEKDETIERNQDLEDQVEKLKQELENKDAEIDKLRVKLETVPAIEYKPSESYWIELMDHKQKVANLQALIDKLNDEINKKQGMLTAHAHLAASLKVERDNGIKYASKLREVLQEARDELEAKNKAIYSVHEKLVLKEREYEKLKSQMKSYEPTANFADKWHRNRCQICMSSLSDERVENSSRVDTEVGKSSVSRQQYVSESLIGMSVKKVNNLRARLDNLKKMGNPPKKLDRKFSWPHEPISDQWRKQIELRGKLYQILQKHADQSCEDFINLLKLTVSNNSSKGMQDELKPSNMKDVDKTTNNQKPSQSFSALYLDAIPFSEICDKLNESGNSDDDEIC